MVMTGTSNSQATRSLPQSFSASELPSLRSSVRVTQLNPATADAPAWPRGCESLPDLQNHNIPLYCSGGLEVITDTGNTQGALRSSIMAPFT